MINLKRCPTCGSSRIRKVRKTVRRTARGRAFSVPCLVFHECLSCGEQVFSPHAMEKIEARRPKPGQRAA